MKIKDSVVIFGCVIILFLWGLTQPTIAYTTTKYAPMTSNGSVVNTLTMGQSVEIISVDGNEALVKRGGISGIVDATRLLGSNGMPLYDPEEDHKQHNPCSGCWITNETWFKPNPNKFYGSALYYAPNVMEAQVISKGYDWDDYVGAIATTSPSDIGRKFWLKRQGSAVWEGPFIAVDVVQRNHIWGLINTVDYALEVDYNTALRWGLIQNQLGRLANVEVSKDYPRTEEAVHFPTWYKETAEFVRNPSQNWVWTPVWSYINARISNVPLMFKP